MSEDQFVVNNPVIFPTGYGQESSSSLFHGGTCSTLHNDSATGIIWVENKVSLGPIEIVLGQQRFEQWILEQACVDIYHMHSNRGIFEYGKFRLDRDNKHQEKYLYGFGAQHQNSRSERKIQTIIYTARTFMVYYYLHWKDHGADEISLWYFAVKNYICLNN